jgi:hypothetical protein
MTDDSRVSSSDATCSVPVVHQCYNGYFNRFQHSARLSLVRHAADVAYSGPNDKLVSGLKTIDLPALRPAVTSLSTFRNSHLAETPSKITKPRSTAIFTGHIYRDGASIIAYRCSSTGFSEQTHRLLLFNTTWETATTTSPKRRQTISTKPPPCISQPPSSSSSALSARCLQAAQLKT